MLASACHAMELSNAHGEVHRGADEITDSNDDDGVAQVIERLLAERSGSALDTQHAVNQRVVQIEQDRF